MNLLTIFNLKSFSKEPIEIASIKSFIKDYYQISINTGFSDPIEINVLANTYLFNGSLHLRNVSKLAINDEVIIDSILCGVISKIQKINNFTLELFNVKLTNNDKFFYKGVLITSL